MLRPVRKGRRAARAAWQAAATAIIWLTSLFVVALWVLGGGVGDLMSVNADSLISLGRITGLVAANLLLYQVLLLARIPVFERGFGRDAIIRLHRWTGFWSFWLMLAHIVLLVIGYAAQSGIDVVHQGIDFVVNYPGMLLATAGTALLVLVVVTSIRRARWRLRYESWHLLHLYAYLGVGLAVPHMLWTGGDFLASPAATAYWWTLWAVAAASVLVFRIGVPLVRSARLGLRVADVKRDGSRGVSVRVSGRALHRLRAEPGQFFVWRFLDGPGWTRGHPFSLAEAPGRDSLTIAVRVVGDGTSRLARLPRGTRVLVEGPYGRMTGAARRGTKLLMISAGAGVAPLVGLLRAEHYAPADATVITRDSAEEDALRLGALRELTETRGVRHIPLYGPRSPGSSPWLPATHAAWRGADLIRHVVPDLENYDVFVCGPAKWTVSVVADLRAAGARADHIHTESFTV
jgi:predicted ferric reductase